MVLLVNLLDLFSIFGDNNVCLFVTQKLPVKLPLLFRYFLFLHIQRTEGSSQKEAPRTKSLSTLCENLDRCSRSQNCDSFSNHLIFHLAPSSGQNFNLPNTLVAAIYFE